jgi:hypothetical protein
MKTYEGVEVELHAFLMLELNISGWSASCPDCFTPGERAGLYIGKEKISVRMKITLY